jgi:hypothetical protein
VSRAKGRQATKPPKAEISSDRGYWRESESPLASLIFLLPMLVLYECGTSWLTPGRQVGEPQVIAFLLIRQFFALLHAHAIHLPALTVAVMLLGWHVAIKDPWRIRLQTIRV